MNPPMYIWFFLLIFWIILQDKKKQATIIEKKIKERRENKENNFMKELAKRFVGKKCLIYTFNSQVVGTIKEVSEDDGAIIVEDKTTVEAVNLDYVTRIREYPKNKKGKDKALVID